MSSLEITAAPWRANACRASLLPAPMPPVMARLVLVADWGLGRNGFVPRGRVDLVGDVR
jgi:hypothetical protein